MADDLFARKASMSYTELTNAIMGYLSIKERMARNHIKSMNELEIIEKSLHNDNEFTLKGLPF
jgi:repressor of nif and glnA expression